MVSFFNDLIQKLCRLCVSSRVRDPVVGLLSPFMKHYITLGTGQSTVLEAAILGLNKLVKLV